MTGSNWFEEYGITDPYYADKYRVIVKDDCREVLPGISGVRAVVTDPPYELGFMGKSWDSKGVSFQKDTWGVVRRSCLHGAPLLSFGGTRTSHRIACAIEDAGWELRDTLMWVYGSGFPKSLDISKAIDKLKGVERERLGIAPTSRPNTDVDNQVLGWGGHGHGKLHYLTEPSSVAAQLWNGYGTALKPAYEPILLAMNSLDGTFANNALRHGVAGLNIDECRIPLNGDSPSGSAKRVFRSNRYTDAKVYGANKFTPPGGRFPANLIHDGSDEVLELFPVTGKSSGGKSGHTGAYGGGYKEEYYEGSKPGFGDGGSAARFFYCAKASRAERDAGLEDKQGYQYRENGFSANISDSKLPRGNNHPTVKPLALMVYLCTLVKTPGYNLILDPFCGSGTTLLACGTLGIRSIGIESDERYCELAANRCAADAVTRIQRGEY
tara:strand:+ start:2274 stop:3587 length:1314 start_codon:yes stop_codon:yes gene_type:complete